VPASHGRNVKKSTGGGTLFRKRGFSLVELIIIIAIMAVLLVVLAPVLLSYTERSRAQKDASAMDEVINAVQLALTDADICDEMLRYSIDNNYLTYTDSSGIYGQTYTDIEFWAPDGSGRATTITFNPTKGFLSNKYVVAEGIVNDMTYGNGSTAGEPRAMLGSQIANNQCYLKNASAKDDSTTAYLYNKIRQSIGNDINIISATYKNSSYTVFIKWNSTDNTIIPDVYGSFNGTNLHDEANASLGSGTKEYNANGDAITRPVTGGVTSSSYKQSDLVGSGSVSAIADYKIERKIKVTKLYGKTTQNGTPSIENPVPLISGGESGSISVTATGKNLAPSSWISGYAVSNTTGELYRKNGYAVTDFIAIQSETHYIWSNPVESLYSCAYFYNENKEYLGRTHDAPKSSFPISSWGIKQNQTDAGGNVAYVRLQLGENATTTGTIDMALIQLPMLSMGNTIESYEPYGLTQTATLTTPKVLRGIPVASGGNYTDATGQQWITDEVDLERGVYIQRIRAVNFATEDFRLINFTYANQNKTHMICYAYNTGVPLNNTFMSSHFSLMPTELKDGAVIALGNGVYIFVNHDAMNAQPIHIALSRDLANNHVEMAQWLKNNNVQINYILYTPIETPLTKEEIAEFESLAESGLINVLASDVFIETETIEVKK